MEIENQQLILTEKILNPDTFRDYLLQVKMMESSITDYLRYHNYIKRNFTNQLFNQELLNIYFSGRDMKGNRTIYLQRNNSLPGRAFIKKFIEYIKINKAEFNLSNEQISLLMNLIIPKITGRQEDYLHSTPLDFFERNKIQETIKALKIIDKKRFTKIQLMWYLSIYGGFRRDELINIKVKDIKIREYKKRILNNPNSTLEIEITKGKGNKKRTIFIPGRFYKLIIIYIKEVLKNSDYFLDKITKDDIKNWDYYLFPNTSANKWFKELKYICVKAGIRIGYYTERKWVTNYKTKERKFIVKENIPTSEIHPHSLRSTCATMLSEKKVSIDNIRVFLGHDSITTTQLYIKPDMNQIKSLYERKI